jgi:hypothetical protein
MLSNIGNIQSMSCDADHRLCFGLFIATLVEFVLANEASHDLIDGLARPFLFGSIWRMPARCRKSACGRMGFEGHDQSRAIDLREEQVFGPGEGVGAG